MSIDILSSRKLSALEFCFEFDGILHHCGTQFAVHCCFSVSIAIPGATESIHSKGFSKIDGMLGCYKYEPTADNSWQCL